MSLDNLPVEWLLTELNQVLSVKNGYAFKSKDYISEKTSDDLVPVIRISDIKDNSVSTLKSVFVEKAKASENFKIDKGDLLIAMSGATTGKTGIFREENPAFLNQRVGNLKVHSQEYFLPKFRNFLIQNLSNQILENAYGGAQPNISSKDIESLKFGLPPLAEQQEIVRQLDVMLAQVEQIKARLDAIPAILKKFRQSVLADAVSGKLTEEWRNNQADISSWTFGELREFIEKPIYGTSAKSSKSGEVPVLRMGNLQNGEIDWSDLVYTSDATEIKKYDLKLNDLLFNRTNSPELVGKTSIYRGNRDAIFAGYLIRVRCLPSLDPEYLNYHLNSHIGREYCYRVKTDGVSQSNINAQKLLAYPLNCPPVNEQKIIVKLVKQYLELIHRIEEIIRSAQKRVNLLTQSILAKAFSGELTAEWREQHQDLITGINSAESLLAKIQAEREASQPAKKMRKKKEV